MNLLAQGIAFAQNLIEPLRQFDDDRGLEAEAHISHLRRQGAASRNERCGFRYEGVEACPKAGRGLRGRQRFDADARRGERILRNVNAIEISVIRGAILQMVDDLERAAEGVRGGPGRLALAVNVEHEAPDRRRRIGAIAHQIVPIRITLLDRVHTEGAQKIERVARGQTLVGRKDCAQRLRRLDRLALFEQRRLEGGQAVELFLRRQLTVVDDVVGAACELIIREDRAAVARGDKERGDWKILALMGFRGLDRHNAHFK